MSVLLETNIGNIVIDLFKEHTKECSTFLELCKSKYYLYSPVHNVQRDYILEWGNPVYPDEPERHIDTNQNRTDQNGTDQNDNGLNSTGLVAFLPDASFIITLTEDQIALKGLKVAVFGKVVEGFTLLDKINKLPLDDNRRPLKDVRILHIYILDDLDSPQQIQPDHPPTDQQIKSFRSMTNTTPQSLDDLKATSQAISLELLQDIPSAHIQPNETVLFICKLNPHTRAKDLELIFSRFGRVKSAEIIKDQDTGDSLCYGFIEFDDEDSVEKAYLKMDGALIDDKRVHVDFSQSVKR